MPAIYSTQGAVDRLTELGVRISKIFLKKARGRGADDPRDKGPDYWRDDRGRCWYDEAALRQYAALKLAQRTFRGPASEPERLRRCRDEHAE